MSTVIFDFDGTIADSFDYVLNFFIAEAGNRRPADLPLDSLRQTTMKDMALALGIPYWRLPLLYFKGRRVMRGHMQTVQPFAGIPEALRELRAAGHTVAIVSSNSTRNIKKFLKMQGLDDCISAVRGGAGIFGKVSLIKQLRFRYKAQNCWYIGDETTDIASAKAAGVASLAVTWGFADRPSLERLEPTAIADSVADIVRLLS